MGTARVRFSPKPGRLFKRFRPGCSTNVREAYFTVQKRANSLLSTKRVFSKSKSSSRTRQGSGCMTTPEHCNLSMVVSPYVGGKKGHVSNGQNVSFKEPCSGSELMTMEIGGTSKESSTTPQLPATLTEPSLKAFSPPPKKITFAFPKRRHRHPQTKTAPCFPFNGRAALSSAHLSRPKVAHSKGTDQNALEAGFDLRPNGGATGFAFGMRSEHLSGSFRWNR